ncbi:MAG: hypothetical protein JSW11_01255 [Candidatus Heimdallarchaeota archaeon]|nr:MAG: hypothetical protein JSW11_01255 [Candidatus Heimdallarchaeota archaeon]
MKLEKNKERNFQDVNYTGKPFIGIVKHYGVGVRVMKAIHESSLILPDEWYHIKVTRESDLFSVYLDGDLIMRYDDPDPFDNYWDFEKESHQFQFASHGQTRFDNITVTENTGKNESKIAPGWDIPTFIIVLSVMIGMRERKRRIRKS